MFLSTKKPPNESLSSFSSNFLNLTTSSDVLDQSLIRDCTFRNQFETMSCSSSRKQIPSSHVHQERKLTKLGLNQTLAKTRKGVSSQSKIIKNDVFLSTSQVSKSVVAARGMVKSKEDSCSDLVKSTSESNMASKTCPLCKIFSSASNTTLNAHIDQCLSLDSAALSPVRRPRVKPRMKFKSIVDIYASAKRCTLEDLDQRNGTKWASISSYTNQVVADKSEVSKKRKVSSAGVGSVYIDTKGHKSRILGEFIKKKTSTTPREQHKDGTTEKKCLSQGNNTCLRKNRRGKKLTNRKADVSKIPEYQRGVSGEGSSTGRRRIYNQRMLAKGSVMSKKLNEKGDEFDALRDQPDDNDDDIWSGGDPIVLRGTALSATYSYPLKKPKVRSEVSERNKTLFESKRAQSRVRMNEKEEDSLEKVHTNTLRSKKSLSSIQEDKYPPSKKSLAPYANSKKKLSPSVVANSGGQSSMPVKLKKAQVDFSEKEDEEGTRKWESEMTHELDDDYVSDDNGETNEILLRSNPSSRGYNDDEESSEEEEDNNERAGMLANTDDACAKFYQSDTSERLINGQTAYEEDVRFDSGVGKGSLYVEVDTIPIPGPPGSFIPSPRDMWFDENLGNSSVITSQVQSSMDQLDRNSSDSPVSAVSNFAGSRLNFPMELSSFFRESFSYEFPVSYSTASTSFCVPSHLLQRRAASSSFAMNLTEPPKHLDPNHPIEHSHYKIQQDLDHQCKFSNTKSTVPPSPSTSVIRLMGKDLIVMNQGEADEETTRSRTPQFLDDPPCAGTGSQFNTDLYFGNSFESKHQPQEEALRFRNTFDM